MEKTVIFIRHTEASKKAGQNADALRALTQKGEADAKKVARSIKPFLAQSSVTLISSPLLRALQTAGFIRKKLDVQIAEEAWVAEGSLDKLQASIAACTSDVMIIVGHEPTLSQWIESCCHARIPMRKGSVCALKFKEDIAEGADLLWYIDKNAVPWNE